MPLKFTLPSKVLAEESAFLSIATNKVNTTIPILKNALLTAKDGALTLAATDLDVTCIATINDDGLSVAEDGAVTAENQELAAFARLAGEMLTLEDLTGDRAALTSDHARIQIPTRAADDYPVLPDISDADGFSFPLLTFQDMIRSTQFCVPDEGDERFSITLLMCKIADRRLEMFGTNGHHLSVASCESDAGKADFGFSKKAASGILRLEGETITVIPGENHTAFRSGNRTLMYRNADVFPPNYSQFLRETSPRAATLNVAALSRAIQLAALASRGIEKGAVRLSFSKGLLTVSAENELRGSSDPVQTDYSGDSFVFGSQIGYISSWLSTVSDCETATLEFLDEATSGPLVWRSAAGSPIERTYLLMPMRA